MRHARHDHALDVLEQRAREYMAQATGDQKYIIIVYDGPSAVVREASFVSNVPVEDVAAVCDAVAKQIRSKRAN